MVMGPVLRIVKLSLQTSDNDDLVMLLQRWVKVQSPIPHVVCYQINIYENGSPFKISRPLLHKKSPSSFQSNVWITDELSSTVGS